jgi:hypothetical protein
VGMLALDDVLRVYRHSDPSARSTLT